VSDNYRCKWCGEEFVSRVGLVVHDCATFPTHLVACEKGDGSGKEMSPMGWVNCRYCGGRGGAQVPR